MSVFHFMFKNRIERNKFESLWIAQKINPFHFVFNRTYIRNDNMFFLPFLWHKLKTTSFNADWVDLGTLYSYQNYMDVIWNICIFVYTIYFWIRTQTKFESEVRIETSRHINVYQSRINFCLPQESKAYTWNGNKNIHFFTFLMTKTINHFLKRWLSRYQWVIFI